MHNFVHRGTLSEMIKQCSGYISCPHTMKSVHGGKMSLAESGTTAQNESLGLKGHLETDL